MQKKPSISNTRKVTQMPKDVALRNPSSVTGRSLVRQMHAKKREELPHLYGWKWYRWARNFFDSRNRINLICGGNQSTKSSSMIRKNIEWACNKKLWKELWPDRNGVPNTPSIFFYFYPTAELATVEFEKKWVPQFMPKGDMKDDPNYGWTAEFDGSDIAAIHFRSGVTLYFRAYSQRLINLQANTVHMISGDEEMPEDYVDELMARVSASDGYFNLAFTATQGYQLWFRAMECQGSSEEVFPQAFKQFVSLYDCQTYEDGSPGHWPLDRIKQREGSCTSESEILRRVHGRFVKDEGRKYANFSPDKNLTPQTPIPDNWRWYGGVDIGSGGQAKRRSAGAVVFIAVSPDFAKGRVTRTWRGDNQETTAGDILAKFKELRGKENLTQACYDYNSREFAIIAARSGEPFIPADKKRDAGEKTLNVLWQSGALTIDADVFDNQKLVTELMSIPVGEKNRRFTDDLSDALRYTCQLINWDFTKISPQFQTTEKGEVIEALPDAPDPAWTQEQYMKWEIDMRRNAMKPKAQSDWDDFYNDLEEWNEAYGN